MRRLRQGIGERAPTTGSYSLRALGTIDLRRRDGTPAEAVLSQPKRLALLVYLTVAKRGALCRRDTVLGVFWPDFEQERARAALRKALHFLRGELGNGVIIGRGDDEIGVDPELISSDVGDFESALETGDLETALGLYAGDFLDGFYVSDAPEFEQWTEATRREVKGQAVRAAERLTQNALEACDPRTALTWARKWVRLAPTDEAATRALMTALDGVGERANALEAYDELVAQLRDLELEPSSETQSLATTIRQKNGEPQADSASVPRGKEVPLGHPAPPTWRRVAIGAATVGALAAVVVLGRAFLRGATAPDAEIESRWIIVAEFDGSADSAIRGAARHLMTVALDQSPGWQVLPSGQIARGKAIAEKPDTARLTEDLALDLAVLGRIPVVVAGQVNRVGSTYALSFRVVNADSGTVVSAIQEIAQNDDDVIPRIDVAVRQLVAGIENGPRAVGPTNDLWNVMTPSMEALQKFRRATDISLDLSGAELDELLQQAVAIDSTFSQAWLRLAYRLAQRRQPDSARAAVRAALSRPERLLEPGRHYAQAAISIIEYDYPAVYRHYIDAWEADGKSQEAADEVGAALLFLGEWERSYEWYQRAKPMPFNRDLAVIQNELRVLRALGRLDELKVVLDELAGETSNPVVLTYHQLALHAAHNEWDRVESSAVEVSADPTHLWSTRTTALAFEAGALAARGQSHAAMVRLRQGRAIRSEQGSAGSVLRYDHYLRLLGLHSQEARAFVSHLPTDTASAYGLLEAAMNSAWAERTREAQRFLNLLRDLPSESVAFLGSAPSVVEATVAASARRWHNVVEILTPMEEWTWPHSVQGTPSYGNLVLYLLAQAHEANGQLDSAVAYQQKLASPAQLSRRGGFRGFHYSFAHQRLVVLYSRMDRVEDAERHWRIFSETFTNPDPELEYLVVEARDALEGAVARAR